MKSGFPVCALTLGFTAAALALTGGAASRVVAQDVIAQPVIQALPSLEVQRLNRALLALAKAPRDRDTLLEAGMASMGVDDLEAAIGFFGRAAEIDPGHPGVAQGLAGVYLRAGRAGEALVQYDRALAAGVPEGDVLADRALTLDLVGEGVAAQAAYTRALTLDPANDEARRRLAISHAIAGNRVRFEETLRPLLDRRDTAAQRARAFGLAILGDSERAGVIVEQVMPRDMSTRLVPYLAYMPRLTKPQQAAAANLGIFPRAADIGREDPRLARFAAEERADNRLTPKGPPLGAPPVAASVAVAAPATAPAPVAAPLPTPVPAPVSVPASAPVAAPGPTFAPTLAPSPARIAAAPSVSVPTPVISAPVPVTTPIPAPTPSAPQPSPAPPSAPLRVADAFADLSSAALPDAQVSGDVVDLSRITIPREAPPPPVVKAPPEKPKPKEPVKPVYPSRVWVQVATGRNIKALGFDWRRIAKEGGAPLAKLKPHTAPWGQSNRLLAGPVDNRDKAQALLRELKAKGLDSFLYVSPEGEEIQPLK